MITFVVAFADGQQSIRDHSASLLAGFRDAPDVTIRHLSLARPSRRPGRHRHALEGLPAEFHWISRAEYLAAVEDPSQNVHLLIPTPYVENYESWFTATWPRVHTVYSGYGPLEIAHWPSGEFELPFFAEVDHLVASSPRAVARFTELGVPREKVAWLGDPFMHRMRRMVERQLTAGRLFDLPPRPVRVLWSPHWTRGWNDGPGFSNWNRTVFDVLEVLNRPDAPEILFRPHGYLRSSARRHDPLPDYASRLWIDPEFDEARRALDEVVRHPKVRVSTGSLADDLEDVTHVLTDGISLIGYGLAAGRITGVVRRDDSPALGAAGIALRGTYTQLAVGADTRSWFPSASAREDPPAHLDRVAAQWKALDEFYPVHESAPGELLLEWIRASD